MTLKNKNQVHATKTEGINIFVYFETNQEAYCWDESSKPGLQVSDVNTDFTWVLTFAAVELTVAISRADWACGTQINIWTVAERWVDTVAWI